VENHVCAAQDWGDGAIVADVGAMDLDRLADFVQVRLMAGQQIVNDNDLRCAIAQQPAHQRRADKSGSSCNHVFAH